MMLISFFQSDPKSTGPTVNVAAPSASPTAPPPVQAPVPAPVQTPAVGVTAIPSGVSVYNPDGNGDNPGRAKYAIDGDPGTVWRTDQYRQQLPALKSGVGLLVGFPSAINLSQVKIDADSPGTKVEIRAADSNNPDLASTRVIGSADLNGPETIVSLPQPQRAQYVIIWITQLGNGGAGKLVSQIGELIFTSAG
jgi:hypothetical protein